MRRISNLHQRNESQYRIAVMDSITKEHDGDKEIAVFTLKVKEMEGNDIAKVKKSYIEIQRFEKAMNAYLKEHLDAS
jgi:transketolase N-terminal domain/subunit